MLSRLEIDTKNRLCIWRISGNTDLETLCSGYAERFSHPDWAPDLMSMTVLSKLGLGSFTPDMAVAFADFVSECDRKYERTPKRAALVCEDDIARALLVFWEKKGSEVVGREERSFVTEQEARDWLLTEQDNAA